MSDILLPFRTSVSVDASAMEKAIERRIWSRSHEITRTEHCLKEALLAQSRQKKLDAIHSITLGLLLHTTLDCLLDVFELGVDDPELLEIARNHCQKWLSEILKTGEYRELSENKLRQLQLHGVNAAPKTVKGWLCLRLLDQNGIALSFETERRVYFWDGNGEIKAECWLAPRGDKQAARQDIASQPFVVDVFDELEDVNLNLDVDSDWGFENSTVLTLPQDWLGDIPVKPLIHHIQSPEPPGRVWAYLTQHERHLQGMTVGVRIAETTMEYPSTQPKKTKHSNKKRSK